MKQFNLPDPGEGLVEAEIVSWKVRSGDEVKVNDVVVEIETAKSLVELPVPWAGTVSELLVEEGTTVEVGSPILTIDTGEGDAPAGGAAERAGAGEQADAGQPAASGDQAASGGQAGDGEQAASDEDAGEGRVANLVGYGPVTSSGKRRARKGSKGAPGQAAEGAQAAMGQSGGPAAGHDPSDAVVEDETSREAPTPEPATDGAGATTAAAPAPGDGAGTDARPLAKPPVRKFAKDHGVDLSHVTPSEPSGVISRGDVQAFLSGSRSAAGEGASAPEAVPSGAAPAAGEQPAAGAAPAYTAPVFDRSGERETRTPVKGVRKMTAQAMTGSAFTAPHVTEFITVDVTATMDLVTKLKADREFRDVKVSPLLIVAKALLLAVKRNPEIVAVWDEQAQEIVQKHYVNLGIAAATPRGLVVPNIKDADLMDLRQLAEAMGNLVETARAGRTQPAEMSGGCITITNVGVFGVDTGTPIINPGESAIVAFGAVRKQPWVVTNDRGEDEIVPRWITQLAVSFDHRLVDGELGSRFLADLAALLEDPSRALVWG